MTTGAGTTGTVGTGIGAAGLGGATGIGTTALGGAAALEAGLEAAVRELDFLFKVMLGIPGSGVAAGALVLRVKPSVGRGARTLRGDLLADFFSFTDSSLEVTHSLLHQ